MDERRDDWRHGVDQNLVSLNAAQRVTDQQLDDLDLKYEIIDKVLRGDPESDTDGFAARLHNIENSAQDFRAELIKLRIADVQVRGFRWDFAKAVAVAIIGVLGTAIGILGLLITNWDKVEALVKAHRHPQEMTHRRRGRVHVVPAPEEEGQTWK